MSYNKSLLVILPSLCFLGCSHHELDVSKLANKTAEEIYNIGNKYKNNKEYEDAVLAFEEVGNQYPYSKYVAESQFEAGKCYFQMKKYENAIATLETFIQTHVTHEKVPEALYILGEIHFNQMPIVQRDQTITVQSLEYFMALCRYYPKCEYVTKAKEKIKILLQHLANHELKIGLYYQKLNNYTAAIARYNTIIESYGNTEVAEEAYHRLVECYLSLGIMEEASSVNIVLQSKHKNSKWAKYSNDLISKYSKQFVHNSNKSNSDNNLFKKITNQKTNHESINRVKENVQNSKLNNKVPNKTYNRK
ncbi:MAG: outer membrane protein assembly factor BamD [Alphaproteobacteria bacterium]|nr:outer membrane protein assembly factor BamD [Alphaproteobacteria bacterium]